MSSWEAVGSKTTLYENNLPFLSPLVGDPSHCGIISFALTFVLFHPNISNSFYSFISYQLIETIEINRLTYICPSPGNCTAI